MLRGAREWFRQLKLQRKRLIGLGILFAAFGLLEWTWMNRPQLVLPISRRDLAEGTLLRIEDFEPSWVKKAGSFLTYSDLVARNGWKLRREIPKGGKVESQDLEAPSGVTIPEGMVAFAIDLPVPWSLKAGDWVDLYLLQSNFSDANAIESVQVLGSEGRGPGIASLSLAVFPEEVPLIETASVNNGVKVAFRHPRDAGSRQRRVRSKRKKNISQNIEVWNEKVSDEN